MKKLAIFIFLAFLVFPALAVAGELVVPPGVQEPTGEVYRLARPGEADRGGAGSYWLTQNHAYAVQIEAYTGEICVYFTNGLTLYGNSLEMAAMGAFGLLEGRYVDLLVGEDNIVDLIVLH